ncbi:MAG: HD domain-containing protein [Actinomycetota bacterium]|nr:HD domain-containing protein [Actinomycetota bacterium]
MDDIKKQFIKDIQTGDAVNSSFLVVRKENRKGKNNRDFIDIELQDNTGRIGAKIWNDSIPRTELFAKKDIVLIEGKAEDSYGKQINIKSLKRIDSEGTDYTLYDFKSRKADSVFLDDMVDFLDDTISGIKNIFLKKLLESFFGNQGFLEKFINSTAAVRNHHALEGGLLIHSMSMVKLCNHIVDLYNGEMTIDRDLLVCGSVLHDIGKTIGYSVENFLDINDEENLISHISLGYGMVLEKINMIKGFPEKTRQELLHIILSHHGLKEFGSPVEPQTLEAIIIYNVDRLDADIDHYFTLRKESLEKNVFQYSNYFRRRIFIRDTASNKNESIKKDAAKKDNKNFLQDKLL